jgi:predicted ArsR family transcriptional regulator
VYEVLDDTAAHVILTIESGDSIRCVAQHLHTPYETVRQAVNRLEDTGYVTYGDGLSVVNERVTGRSAQAHRCQRRRQSTFHRGGVRHPTVR